MKPRKAQKKLLDEATSRKVSILLGARQVGKTTLLKALFEQLSKDSPALFLDLDIYSNYEKVSSFENLVNTLRLNGWTEDQKRYCVFLDEFQRYPGMALILKNAYDHLHNLKIFASGSSSLRIKDEVQESLAGRKLITIIHPLDFEEFLWFKQRDANLILNVRSLKGKGLAKVTSSLFSDMQEFIVFGGYPEVVLSTNKKQVLDSIFDLFIKKDLIEYLKIEKVPAVKQLIEFLAINNSQKIKYDEAGQACSLSFKEIKAFISILRESYLIEEVRPFFKNRNTELVKIPKIYFLDNGVRNYFINNFNAPRMRDDAGYLFEGYLASELTKKGYELRYWQDKNKHEVDFILKQGERIKAIEVKFKKNLKGNDLLGLKTFISLYEARAFLINLDRQELEEGIQYLLPYHLTAVSEQI